MHNNTYQFIYLLIKFIDELSSSDDRLMLIINHKLIINSNEFSLVEKY